MTDIEHIMKLFNIDAEKAQEIISSGFRVDILREGWNSQLSSELTDINNQLDTVISDFFEERQK